MKYLIILFVLITIFLLETNWLNYPLTTEQAMGISESELPTQNVVPDEPKIEWLGHAGFLIRINKFNILIDPNLSEHCQIIHRTMRPFVHANELPDIDAVLISHAHYDHLDIPTLEGIKELKKIILPAKTEQYLPKDLRDRSIPLEMNQTINLNQSDDESKSGLKIIQVKAKHNGSRNHPFSSDFFATGYIIVSDELTIYYSGDTGFGNHFEDIANKYNPDISILPIGSYEPYFILKNYHLDPADAIKAAKILKSKTIIPSHFGTFRLAIDRTNSALPEFIKLAKQENINWNLKIYNKLGLNTY